MKPTNTPETTLDKTYTPAEIESRWYEHWEEAGYFKPAKQGQAFTIMIPPPNVTGSLHMGHAFEATIMDTLVRYQRMNGCKTLWQVGTDHAGIATQMVVERNLKSENTSRLALGRDAFVEKIWEWKNESGSTITKQLRRMAASVDWTRERFTMDEGMSKSVQHAFIQLYQQGLIYRGERLVNWDPVFQTAISDLEVVQNPEQGTLWSIDYPLVSGDGHLRVATTRPETLFGDMAVAVNPNDERYKHLIGQSCSLPLTERTIPIIADDYVSEEFGTGCVKITPAHDFNDFEVGNRHKLEALNILTPSGELNSQVPEAFQGLSTKEARKHVLAALEQQGLLAETKDHELVIPRGDRSGAVIEPYLTKQWYVKMTPLAEPAIKAVQEGKIRFLPKQWENTYYAWLNDIQDWCISRQLWWGHRIPVWYDEAGNEYVGANETLIRENYKIADDVKLNQDEDVLDTWFSSALWPFSTLGWPEQTPDLKTFYPTNALVTGFDIIFFWVARMIMFGLHFTKQVPFKEVYIHGLIRDSEGQKMSKSKGNVLDPLDLIDGIDKEALLAKRTQSLMQPEMAKKIARKTEAEFPEGIKGYGTDALRFTFASLASTGRNIQFDFNRLEGYRNFCNKLWNAARYILMQANHCDSDLGDGALRYSLADNWINSKLQSAIAQTREAIDNYRFDLAANTLYEFVWHEFCDWYLELSKAVLNNEAVADASKQGTYHTLLETFEAILRLLHPFIPYITEEIWQKIHPFCNTENKRSIMLTAYPQSKAECCDESAEQAVDWVKQIIVAIRNIRGEMNLSPAKPIPVLLQHGDSSDAALFTEHAELITTLAKCSHMEFLAADITPPASTTTLIRELAVRVPLEGLIDSEKELQRLQKVLDKHLKALAQCEKKLANEKYVSNAPAEVVAQEREKAAELAGQIKTIEQQQLEIQQL